MLHTRLPERVVPMLRGRKVSLSSKLLVSESDVLKFVKKDETIASLLQAFNVGIRLGDTLITCDEK